MAQLIVISGPDAEQMGKNFPVSHGDTLGSGSTDTIFLNSAEIQSQHARIKLHGQTVQMIASNPEATFTINGDEVKNCNLGHGDIIGIGDYTLMFNDESATRARKTTKPIEQIFESRIESRQKHYDSAQRVIESLGTQEKSQSRLLTLYKISNAISGLLDLDHLLKRFLEIILEEFGADRGFILLFDLGKEKLIPVAAISKKGENVDPSISSSIVEEVLSSKESLLCENIFDDARFKSQESLVRHNIGSAMSVPLIRQGSILGLIHVDSQQRSKFSMSDLDLLTKVALQAAIVIENASFYKVRQEFNRNLMSLYEATQQLSSYLRHDLIVKDAAGYAAQIFNTQQTYLFLKEGDSLKLVSATGLEEPWQGMEAPPSIKQVAQENRPLLIHKKTEERTDLVSFLQNRNSLIAVPVSQKTAQQESSLGVLCIVQKKDGQPFTLEDQQLLSILAGYTAIALSNSSFYEEIKRKEKEIAEWNLELEKRVAQRSEQLKKTQDKLIQSEKMAAVGLLASGVSHEFNNIVASMYGFAQIAKKNEKYREKLVDVVIEQSKRACDITERLVSFSKQKGDTSELTDLHEILEAVLKLTLTGLENEGIEVVKAYGDLPRIVVNAGKIQQVFVNILINARHAIEKNGTITIATSLSEDRQWVHISFKDTGKGIDPENITKVFEPFYTTKGSFGGGTQPGLGIGLSLCYNIVSLHGGDITVSSRPGAGSCFTVILPVKTEIVKMTEEEKEEFKGIKKRSGERSLVVEQSESVRNLLTHILEEIGFEVYQAQNGLEAIESCKKERFHCIFVEARSLGEKSVEVMEEIRKLETHTRIILITGRAEDSRIMQFVGSANGYLRKPFDAEEVRGVLSSHGKRNKR